MGGTELLDAFTGRSKGGQVTPIHWGQDGGDYHLDQEDVKRSGKGSHNRGFRLLSRLFRDHS